MDMSIFSKEVIAAMLEAKTDPVSQYYQDREECAIAYAYPIHAMRVKQENEGKGLIL